MVCNTQIVIDGANRLIQLASEGRAPVTGAQHHANEFGFFSTHRASAVDMRSLQEEDMGCSIQVVDIAIADPRSEPSLLQLKKLRKSFTDTNEAHVALMEGTQLPEGNDTRVHTYLEAYADAAQFAGGDSEKQEVMARTQIRNLGSSWRLGLLYSGQIERSRSKGSMDSTYSFIAGMVTGGVFGAVMGASLFLFPKTLIATMIATSLGIAGITVSALSFDKLKIFGGDTQTFLGGVMLGATIAGAFIIMRYTHNSRVNGLIQSLDDSGKALGTSEEALLASQAQVRTLGAELAQGRQFIDTARRSIFPLAHGTTHEARLAQSALHALDVPFPVPKLAAHVEASAARSVKAAAGSTDEVTVANRVVKISDKPLRKVDPPRAIKARGAKRRRGKRSVRLGREGRTVQSVADKMRELLRTVEADAQKRVAALEKLPKDTAFAKFMWIDDADGMFLQFESKTVGVNVGNWVAMHNKMARCARFLGNDYKAGVIDAEQLWTAHLAMVRKFGDPWDVLSFPIPAGTWTTTQEQRVILKYLTKKDFTPGLSNVGAIEEMRDLAWVAYRDRQTGSYPSDKVLDAIVTLFAQVPGVPA